MSIGHPEESSLTRDAENAVLAAMLMDRTAAEIARSRLDESAFESSENRLVFRALSIDESTEDPITLCAKLEEAGDLEAVGGKDRISGLIDEIPTAANVEHHIEIVRKAALRRRTRNIAAAGMREIAEPGIDPLSVVQSQQEALSEAVSWYGPRTAARIALADDVEIESLPEPPWLVDNVIPGNGLIQLFGKSEGYKTFVAIDLSCRLATGTAWHDRQVTRGPVVYICAEGTHGIKHRVQAWKRYHRWQGRVGVYFLRTGITIADGASDVIDLVNAIKGVVPSPLDLIVVDTFARNFRGNENTAEDVGKFIKGCDQLREATGSAVLVLHHIGHSENERARGSSAIYGALDTSILCVRDGDRVTLTCDKQKDAPHFPALSFEAVSVPPSLVLNAISEGGGRLDGNRHLCLLTLYREFDEKGTTHGKWMEATGLVGSKKSGFSKARNWLVDQSYVIQREDRRYVVTEAGRLALGLQSTSGLPPVYRTPVNGGLPHGGLEGPVVDRDPVDLFEETVL